jgi:hypothetical protein
MSRVNNYINAVRLALPTDNPVPKITVSTMTKWVFLMANRYPGPLDGIPDDIVNQEYNHAISIICSNGHPTKFIQVLYVTAENLLAAVKEQTTHTEDSLSNSVVLRGEHRHNFCLGLIRDLFAQFEQDGMSVANEPETHA